MKLRKLAALTMAGVLAAAGLSACGGGSAPDTGAAAEAGESKGQALAGDNAEPDVVLQVAFENSGSEPVGAGWEKAQELIRQKSGGTKSIEMYPDSQQLDK